MTLPNSWRILGYLCGSFAIVLLIIWTGFYLDSIHQRHRAEGLIADLKSFPFQSATFDTVRDFSLAHGGGPELGLGILQDPHIPSPSSPIDSLYDRVCNPYKCVFQINFQNRALTAPRPVLLALYDLGIRPWSVDLRFEIAGDHLAQSWTRVMTTVQRPLAQDGSQVFVDVGYVVISETPRHTSLHPPEPTANPNYSVHYRYFSNSPHELLQTRFLQIDTAPVTRAYDIDLHCLTALTSNCTHALLAPSAWADRRQPQP